MKFRWPWKKKILNRSTNTLVAVSRLDISIPNGSSNFVIQDEFGQPTELLSQYIYVPNNTEEIK